MYDLVSVLRGLDERFSTACRTHARTPVYMHVHAKLKPGATDRSAVAYMLQLLSDVTVMACVVMAYVITADIVMGLYSCT